MIIGNQIKIWKRSKEKIKTNLSPLVVFEVDPLTEKVEKFLKGWCDLSVAE